MLDEKEKMGEEYGEAETPDAVFEDVEVLTGELEDDGSGKKMKFYENLRKKFAEKIPKDGIFSKVTDYLFLLPDFFILLCRLFVDKRVNGKIKMFALGVAAYVMLPVDIIPDFIPIVGYLDDLILVAFALDQILRQTDETVILENWSGKADIIKTVQALIVMIDEKVSTPLTAKVKLFMNKMMNKEN